MDRAKQGVEQSWGFKLRAFGISVLLHAGPECIILCQSALGSFDLSSSIRFEWKLWADLASGQKSYIGVLLRVLNG